ncbi:SPFH domain-containing protein [Ornithinimicrobium pratense]|uniref:SPFH/Band 7/PHB domain protein n=1 Tax=Ornithinimicrobium pratense TaxID=2593973 RepID=A0A5J6V917_9MICO|nr:SPFH domain-containing protein [Ornithinimicrobium pratense]QFG69621.1 SPFH/Band 7/PHB domain protein [Ornithinimicrobium pratense]
MEPTTLIVWLVVALLVLFVVVAIARAIRIVPQATSVIVERLGKYDRSLDAGLHFLVPFVDRPRSVVDLREQVVSFPPQPVITSDNLVVSIDTVIYFQPTDPKAATYEIANYIQGIEQLTVTTLRNVIGSLDLEQTLTSRDMINGQLRGVLDEATGRWGIRVNRVELKAIDPPASVQDSMEKQMRAERDRRATILNAEGVKQSQILTAEGEKQAQILRAEGTAQSAILESQGEARAILQVFDAIHKGNPDSKLLAYQYLQMLPEIAKGDSNQMWVVPTELTAALSGIGKALGGGSGGGSDAGLDGPSLGLREDAGYTGLDDLDTPMLEDPKEALRRAREEAEDASRDAEGATKQRDGKAAEAAVAEAARKAKAAQQQRADADQDQARQLGQMPQQDQAVPDLPEQGQAEAAQPHTAHRDQPGATSWERPQGERKPWDQSQS